MLPKTMNLLSVGAVVVTGVSLLVNIVSMSTYYWFETKEVSNSITVIFMFIVIFWLIAYIHSSFFHALLEWI